MINLFSDNASAAAPAVMEALAAANRDGAMPYGADVGTARAAAVLAEMFECPVWIAPVPTGTAANALSMSILCRPYGAVFTTECAHIHTSEGGATEFFTGGAKVATLAADDGRMRPEALDAAIKQAGVGLRFRSQPDAVSITNATELGTVYPRDTVAGIAEIARRHKLAVHMDGARLANAVARLGCSPAELTWRAGVDVLSLGLTKTGAMSTDVVVCFEERRAEDMAHRARRCGFTFSKMRFAAAQIVGLLSGGGWIALAAHANKMATRLAEGLRAVPGTQILHPVEVNHIFVRVSVEAAESLPAHGLRVGHRGGGLIRIVTSWATTDAMVDAAIAAFAAALKTSRRG